MAASPASWGSSRRFAGLLHALLRALAFIALGQREQLAPREPDLAVAVDAEHLDLDGVALLEHVLDPLDARVRHLRDVQQAVGAGQDLDERAEVRDALDRALVDRADLGLRREALDDVERLLDRVAVGSRRR